MSFGALVHLGFNDACAFDNLKLTSGRVIKTRKHGSQRCTQLGRLKCCHLLRVCVCRFVCVCFVHFDGTCRGGSECGSVREGECISGCG